MNWKSQKGGKMVKKRSKLKNATIDAIFCIISHMIPTRLIEYILCNIKGKHFENAPRDYIFCIISHMILQDLQKTFFNWNFSSSELWQLRKGQKSSTFSCSGTI